MYMKFNQNRYRKVKNSIYKNGGKNYLSVPVKKKNEFKKEMREG